MRQQIASFERHAVEALARQARVDAPWYDSARAWLENHNQGWPGAMQHVFFLDTLRPGFTWAKAKTSAIDLLGTEKRCAP